MTSLVTRNQTNYVLEQCEHAPPKKLSWQASHLVSIFNDTDNPIKVDFNFSYSDKYYETAANISGLRNITRANNGLNVGSKEWQEIYIDEENEFHPHRGVTISNLFQLRVNGENVYNNYKYKENGKSTQMIQNYNVEDPNQLIPFPCALKISHSNEI